MSTRCSLLLALLAIVVSCTRDNKSYQVDENMAMTAFPIPLFMTKADAIAGKSSGMLDIMKPVYTTGDSINSGGRKFVRIVWADSSAYVHAGWLTPHGRVAVLFSGSTTLIPLYADEAMTKKASDFYYWSVQIVGDPGQTSTPIRLTNVKHPDDAPGIRYVANNMVFTDSLNIRFFFRYYHARANAAALEELKNDQEFAGLKSYSLMFGRAALNEPEEVTVPTVNKRFPQSILDKADDDLPGTIKIFFVYEDGTEIPGDTLNIVNGKASGKSGDLPNQPGGVRQIRFDFTPDKWCRLHFYGMAMDMIVTDIEDFGDVFAGETYSYTIETDCFPRGAVIQAGGAVTVMFVTMMCVS